MQDIFNQDLESSKLTQWETDYGGWNKFNKGFGVYKKLKDKFIKSCRNYWSMTRMEEMEKKGNILGFLGSWASSKSQLFFDLTHPLNLP